MISKEAKRKHENNQHREEDDPVLLMRGVGKELWQAESGDSFIARLRSEDPPVSPPAAKRETAAQNLSETAWRRIESHQGEGFRTVKGLPFTYRVEGAGIWFFRNGKRINRKLTRAQVDVAVSRCPLKTTTEIKDLMDYAYLFALLRDRRIRGEAW